MSDQYDYMNSDQLRAHLKIRGKPSWADFSAPEIRSLLRDLDYDEQRLEEEMSYHDYDER